MAVTIIKTKAPEENLGSLSTEVMVSPDSGELGESTYDKYMQHYLKENLYERDRPYTLEDVSKHFGVTYGYIRNKASKHKWNVVLHDILMRRQKESASASQELQVVSEVEIRMRQARFARLAMNKAILKIQAIQPDTLTVREAMELLRLGLQEERRALGLIESVTYAIPATDPDVSKLSAIQQAMAVIDQIAKERGVGFSGERLSR